MTWVITAVVATGFLSARAQQQAGKQQQFNIEAQAKQERMSATGEEISRRERLNQVLSANIQSLSASGITGEGSPQSVSLASAKTVASSEGAQSLSDKIRQDLLKREARSARVAGSTQAVSTLLNTGIGAAQLSKDK